MRHSFHDIPFKASYESGVDDLVQDFYVPVLDCSTSYDRIAGFFSSSSLAIAAQGIAGLIQKRGNMRLIASPNLSPEDAKIIAASLNAEESFFEGKLLSELEQVQTEFERDHIQALGWMLANGYLEMRLAYGVGEDSVQTEKKLFHQKIGILTDLDGNTLSFSGSINESASGWLDNIEEFKVFRAWQPGQEEFYQADKTRFEAFWSGARKNVRVVDIPQAVKERLIQESRDFSVERLVARYYLNRRKVNHVEQRLSLFPYQRQAMQMWVDNQYRLLFEMATGTGKTRTALACVNHAMQKENRFVVVIACPQTTLSRQWKENEVEPAGFSFDLVLIADGTNSAWREKFDTILRQISIGLYHNAVVYTTHTTASDSDFINLIQQSNPCIQFCFVADEAHGLGAPKSKRALTERYKYRIGLSATPKRWFDEYGTQILLRFFGENSFVFSIADALTTINPITNKPFLVNYYYCPIFITLSDDELERYRTLSNRIRRLSAYAKSSDEYQNRYESLCFERADIQKNAENKYAALEDILSKMPKVKNTLLFVSPEQLNHVLEILKKYGISAHRFTEKQGASPKKKYGGFSERQYLIQHFKEGNYQALVAISCLDEGIDIPSADTAILMSNSTNPREYVQRIGRVIRQAEGKTHAKIYDFIVEPDWEKILSSELLTFEKQIFEKELQRASDMATNAINNAEVQVILDQKLEEGQKHGVE